ncbi:P1 family peptidase [Alteraurantiacibacter aestuarii]|uniref:S58 family peptidase n=1 Tax=Alteraurantiacibacter aestuarii TaxID=650004 RepID=A0A844ZKM4_9SPHN|nr:P1 family peptidase [Alteraurantiacibacter aestuarii]MXO88114.1 S58 family peptidase [Alteraurantiacibacter aestuarii]
MLKIAAAIALTALSSAPVLAQTAPTHEPRARDLGVPFDGETGPLNAITDVAGVTVGFATIVEDDDVRTGVTAVLPRGADTMHRPAFAGWFSLNGNGEMTGTAWIDESGFLEGPVMITNTHSVGVVRDAVIQWRVAQGGADATGYWWSLPVVAETWDGHLNDINGFHVKPEHVFEAIEGAHGGSVEEGNVGGGTGMICYELKCGTGTASRVLTAEEGGFTVGVLVQANHGLRDQATIAGVPIGRELDTPRVWNEETGSIIIVVATDAPLLPTQLQRLARRASLGLARTGAVSGNGSGDIFIAFSTANPDAASENPPPVEMIANGNMDPLFTATVQAVEEAIVNAMVAGQPMTGAEGHHVPALDHDQLRQILARHGRLAQ